MSYLSCFVFNRSREDKFFGKVDVFGVRWRSTSGTIQVTRGANGEISAYYNRCTKLGGLLWRNHEYEQRYIAKALAEHYCVPFDETRIMLTGLT